MITKALLIASLFLSSSASAQGFWSGESSAQDRELTSPTNFNCGKKVFAHENGGRKWYACKEANSMSNPYNKYKRNWVVLSGKKETYGGPPLLIFYRFPKKCGTLDPIVQVAYTTETVKYPYKLVKVRSSTSVHQMFKSLVEISAPYLYKHSCSVAGINVEATNLDIELVSADRLYGFYGAWGSPWVITFGRRPDGELMFE